MKFPTKLALGAVCIAALPAAANATILDFTISHGATILETFSLDDSAGHADPLPGGFIYFDLISDSKGYDGVFFGKASTSNDFGVGYISNFPEGEAVAEYWNDYADTILYSGTGVSLAVGAGTTFSTQYGNTVTVEAAAGAVPEPASWAMMLGGFGLVGGALRSRRKISFA